jgi:hypothetical protein
MPPKSLRLVKFFMLNKGCVAQVISFMEIGNKIILLNLILKISIFPQKSPYEFLLLFYFLSPNTQILLHLLLKYLQHWLYIFVKN